MFCVDINGKIIHDDKLIQNKNSLHFIYIYEKIVREPYVDLYIGKHDGKV